MTAQQAFSDPQTAILLESLKRHDYSGADHAIAAGANVNSVGREGISPLLWLMGETLEKKPIEYLLRAGANPNYQDESTRVSAMYFAVGGSRTTQILELLLDYHGDPNLIGPRNQPLLVTALEQGQDDSIRLLLKHGANINWADRGGSTAASAAVAVGRYDWAIYFVQHGLATSHLPDLARTVAVCVVPAHSKAERLKEQLVALLAAKGVAIPQVRRQQQ